MYLLLPDKSSLHRSKSPSINRIIVYVFNIVAVKKIFYFHDGIRLKFLNYGRAGIDRESGCPKYEPTYRSRHLKGLYVCKEICGVSVMYHSHDDRHIMVSLLLKLL